MYSIFKGALEKKRYLDLCVSTWMEKKNATMPSMERRNQKWSVFAYKMWVVRSYSPKDISERFDLEVFQHKCMHALATQHSSSTSAMPMYIVYTLRFRDEQISPNCHPNLHLWTGLHTITQYLKIEQECFVCLCVWGVGVFLWVSFFNFVCFYLFVLFCFCFFFLIF